MTTADDLRPYDWPVKELTEARVAFICDLVGNHTRMREHLATLPREAVVDLCHQLPVMLATCRDLAGPTPMKPYEPRILHDSIRWGETK
jgi:hypothetical protein